MKNYEKISVAKGIGIVLMVIGHTRCSIALNNFIYLFHMPLFVCCSGYCFKDKYLSDTKGFVAKRIKGLYVPFIFWAILYVLLHNLMVRYDIINSSYGLSKSIAHIYEKKEILSSIGAAIFKMQSVEDMFGASWFIRSLFFGSLFAYALLRLIKSKWIQLCLPLVLAEIFSFFSNEFAILKEARTISMFAFLYIIALNYKKREKFDDNIIILIIGFVFLVLGYFFWPVGMLGVDTVNMVPYLCSAIGGILILWIVCDNIVTRNSLLKRVLVFVGNKTMPVLALHFLCFKIVSEVIILIYNLPHERLAEYPVMEEYSKAGWWIAYLFLGVGVPVAISWMKDKIGIWIRER